RSVQENSRMPCAGSSIPALTSGLTVWKNSVYQRVATLWYGCASLLFTPWQACAFAARRGGGRGGAPGRPGWCPRGCCPRAGGGGQSTEFSPAAGVRVRPGRASSGDTGEVRGGAGGWARVKSGCIFPILPLEGAHRSLEMTGAVMTLPRYTLRSTAYDLADA